MAKVIPNRLEVLRRRSRLTQEEVAKLTGKDVTTISRHESGERGLDKESIVAYARIFKVESFELFLSPDDLDKSS